jgi:hypothetical protein
MLSKDAARENELRYILSKSNISVFFFGGSAVMQHYVTEPARVETKIKLLRGVTVFCQRIGCGREATHLFRSGTGPVAAYCELHAEVEADRIGVDLPLDRERLLDRFIRRFPQSEFEADTRGRDVSSRRR